MKNTFFMVILLLGVAATAAANEPKNEFKPSGKVYGSAFTGFNVYALDGDNGDAEKSFTLDRLEIGYVYNYSENWLFKGCFDIGDPKDDSNLQHTAFARNAFAEYHNERLKVQFGMITGISFNFIEKRWGYRYVEKCYQEYFGYSASRDIGITGSYKVSDAISVDAIISNGEGYKSKQKDLFLEYGIGATLKPLAGVWIRAYADMINGDSATEDTYSFMMGYDFKNGSSIGGEYNTLRNQKMREGMNQSGYSFYGTLKCKKVKLYARYDFNNREELWNNGNDTNMVFLGAEFSPIKGIKITPNYIHANHSLAANPSESYYRVSCEIKF
ncbi:MAG: porin [Mangrovibacterium sp.]